MPHHRLVEGLRPSVVQVRARVAEPPQRRPIRRTRPPRPGRRRRRAVPDRGWPSRRRQRGRDPPEQHNPAPGGGGTKTGRGARGRTGSSEGPRVRQADHPRYNQFVPRRCFVRVFREVFIRNRRPSFCAQRSGCGANGSQLPRVQEAPVTCMAISPTRTRTSRPWQPVHAAVLRRAEGCDANRTSGRSSSSGPAP